MAWRGFARRARSHASSISALRLVGLVLVWSAALMAVSLFAAPAQAWAQAVPVVTELMNPEGSTEGGESVMIRGSGFTQTAVVRFGANVAAATWFGDTMMLATAPPGTGIQQVTVTTAGGTSATHAGSAYTYRSDPVAYSIDPSRGSSAGGNEVEIWGLNLGSATSVTFGGSPAAFVALSSSTLRAVSPPGLGTVDVLVTTPAGTTTASFGTEFTYERFPFVTSVSPQSSPEEGGAVIQISGSNFTGATQVLFGAVPAAGFTVVSNSLITATAPAGQGYVDVTVRNPHGVSQTSGATGFNYMPKPHIAILTPSTGPVGSNVNITGSGFGDAPIVKFGAATATVLFNDQFQTLIVRVPTGTGAVNVTVQGAGGTSATSPATLFTYDAGPVVTSLNPARGSVSGGTSVQINGAALTGATAVTFAGTPATSFTVNSASRITAIAPAGSAGIANVVVTTPDGSSVAKPFTYVALPAVTSVVADGPNQGGYVYVNGTALADATTVTFGGAPATIGYNGEQQIWVTPPAGTPGQTVDVIVTTPMGTSTANANARYTYPGLPSVTQIEPRIAPVGASTTISGSLLSDVTVVKFGTLDATIVSTTATSVTVTVPAGVSGETVDVRVTNGVGQSATSAGSRFTYGGVPTIASMSPTTGPAAGATSVTIQGTGFSGTSRVYFGSNEATNVTVVSPTRITAISPVGRGAVNVRVITEGGGTSADSVASAFTYVGGSIVHSVSPNSGPSDGGTVVTINGEDFLPESTVSFGATPAASVTYVSPTVLEAVTPAGGTGSVEVRVTTNGYTDARSWGTFTYQGGAPRLTNVSPPRGSVAGGQYITLSGAGFDTVTAVMFGNVSVPFTAVHDTLITLYSPPGSQAETVEVSVVNPNGTSAPGAGSRFTFGDAPAISSITPAVGYPEGGTVVTLTGYSLTGTTVVKFGATPATSFSVVSDTRISAIAPAGVVNGNSIPVTVESPTGASYPNIWFTYRERLTIQTQTLPAAAVGLAYNQVITLSEAVNTTNTILNGALPAGLAVQDGSPTRIHGTPTASGMFAFTLQMTGDDGRSVSKDYVLEVAAPTVLLAPTTIANMVQGVAYSQALVASGGTAPYAYVVTEGSLPAGVTLAASTGLLSGTPTGFGPYSFAVTVTDSTGGSGPFTLRRLYEGVVEASRPVAADRTATADYDSPSAMDLAFSITGQTATAVTVVAQPAHGTVSVSGTVVTYTPTVGYVGGDSFTYTASGGGAVSNVATVTIQVLPPVIEVIATLPALNQAAPYSGLLVATGGAAPYTFSLQSGALPPGLALAANGAITGTPTNSGSFLFTVKVVDSSTGVGAGAQATYSLDVGAPPPPVAEPRAVTVAIQPGPNGSSAEIDLSDAVQYASGIQITRQPMHGALTVDGFKVTYTPVPGYFGEDSFDYVAVPIANNPAARMARAAPAGATVTLTIAPPTLAFDQTTLPAGDTAAVYGQTLTVSGGTAPYSYAVTAGTLPAGISLSPGGVLSGTPTSGGVFNLTITATDSSTGTGPFSVAQAYSLTIGSVPETAAPIAVSTTQGREVIVDLTAGATGGPFTAAQVVSLTPSTAGEARIVEAGSGATRGYRLSFTSTGTFSGLATVTYRLSNASGPSAPGTVDITIEARPDPSQDPDVRGIVAAQADAAMRMAEAQVSNFGRRMESLHTGGSRRFDDGVTLGFGFADGGLIDPWTQREIDQRRTFDFTSQAVTTAATQDPAKGLAPPRGLMAGGNGGGSGEAGEGRVSVWTGGSIQFGRRDPKNGDPKFDFTTAGLSFGSDVRLSDQLAIGVGGGFGQSEADVGSKGSSVEATNYFAVVYGSLLPVDGAFIDGMVGYGKLDFDTRRKVLAGVLVPADVYAVGSRSGDQLVLSVSAGWDFRRGDLFLSPYARVSSVTGTLDAYSETGAGLGNLRFDDQDLDSLKLALGLRGERMFRTDRGLLTPRFRIEYQRELKDSQMATMSYDDWVGGPLFSVLSDPFEREQWLFGIGGELRRKRAKFSLDYQGSLVGGGDVVSEVTGQISIAF